MSDSKDHLKQLDELLATSSQAWLFGAGISLASGLPLMGALTTRIFELASDNKYENEKKILDTAKALLPTNSHIEHILSHLCDYIALAERSVDKKATIGNLNVSCDDLRKLHEKVLSWIADTIRWGYVAASSGKKAQIGEKGTCIVKINYHQQFMEALFNRTQAGIANRRSPVKLFTTNYDTLLEDALSLSCFSYWDGFSGGAVAYRSFHYGDKDPDTVHRAHVIKLHGSIDWHLSEDGRVWRVRDGDHYPSASARVLIYPQSTKYLATQRDPFSSQFELFRRFLNASNENILAVCGYSCGDDHINQEIELALQRIGNKTTLLIFSRTLDSVPVNWRTSNWSKRLYCITEDGLYVGNEGPFGAPLSEGKKRKWWTFEGVTDLLNRGAEAYVK